MVRKIRSAAGQDGPKLRTLHPRSDEGGAASWLLDDRVVGEVNADLMLERGVHPIGKIREAVGALRPGEVVVLRSSFRPQPLIETMQRSRVAVYASTEGAAHLTYFGKQAG